MSSLYNRHRLRGFKRLCNIIREVIEDYFDARDAKIIRGKMRRGEEKVYPIRGDVREYLERL